MVLQKTFDKFGNHNGFKLNPTVAMWYVVAKKANIAYAKFNNSKLLSTLQLCPQLIQNWKTRYNVTKKHKYYKESLGECLVFEEWWDQALQNAMAPIKEMLELVGKTKASEGDFPFWQALAKTHGVVKHEVIETRNLNVTLDGNEKLTDSDFAAKRKAIMDSLLGVEQSGGPEVVEPVADEQESTNAGDREVSQRPVVLPDKVGEDV